MSLLLLFPNQPAQSVASYVNLAQALNDLWPPLNAMNAADAIFWTEAELYQWLDDALDSLASHAPLFVVYDQSLAAINGQGAYTQVTSPEFISTLQADLAGSVLRARNVQQLEALDDSWPTSSGTPEAFVLDTQGLLQILLYKVPGVADAGKLIGQVMQVDPLEVDSTHAIHRSHVHARVLHVLRAGRGAGQRKPRADAGDRGVVPEPGGPDG